MTKRILAFNENINTPAPHIALSAERQEEQAIMLEPFYERLIGMTFAESTAAIERCRDLCAEFGFTVKQEASTHRNIYVYCSREGLPDSLRNPKSNPQRKRPSKRCDCRWRVVLYENEKNQWEFRKSLNPEAGKHNHELMRPEEIERSWPKDVTALICELARLRMSTQDIRSRVRGQFPNIHWNERRFYNRLSEERQKIKLRDSAERTHQLTQLWSKVCMATAGNDDLSQFVKQELTMLFQSICETVQINPESFPSPLILKDDDDSNNNNAASSTVSTPSSTANGNDNSNTNDSSNDNFDTGVFHSSTSNTNHDEENSNNNTNTSITTKRSPSKVNAPKGFLSVEIPKQIYYIKIHGQRQLHETPLLKNQRRVRTYSDGPSISEPARKVSRKGKGRQQSSSLAVSDNSLSTNDANIHQQQQHNLSPLIPQPYTDNNNHNNNNRNATATTSRQQQQQQQLHQPTTTFIYYENSSMPLDSSLSNYVNPTFQNTFSMSPTPNTPGFNTQELTFSFDSSMGRMNESGNNNNDNSNEPTIHPALQSNPMSHQQQQQQQQQSQQQSQPPKPIMQQQQSSQSQRMYSNNNNNNSNKPPMQQQQIRIIYEAPKDNDNSSSNRSYQRQQPGLYMRQSSSPGSNNNHGNTILPMYPQQPQQPHGNNSDNSRINNNMNPNQQ